MSVPYKPANYNTLSPYLVVTGADATIEFLTQVFGATLLDRFPCESGRVLHAEVRVDDTVLMLSDEAPPQWPSVAGHVHVYVPDVDATYDKALKFGATSVQVPAKGPDENKRGAVKDSGGTTWWISTKVE